MNYLEKLDMLFNRYNLNAHSFSTKSGIPYTTVVGWYKKGYDSIKVSTLKIVSEFFNTTLDFWIRDDISDPNYGKSVSFHIEYEERAHLEKMRALDRYGQEAVEAVLNIEHRRCTQENRKRRNEE